MEKKDKPLHPHSRELEMRETFHQYMDGLISIGEFLAALARYQMEWEALAAEMTLHVKG